MILKEQDYFNKIYWNVMVPKKYRYMIYKIAEDENCTKEEIYFRIIQMHHKEIFEHIEKTFKEIQK